MAPAPPRLRPLVPIHRGIDRVPVLSGPQAILGSARGTSAARGAISATGRGRSFRHGEPTGRWILTFSFGLIHGFGFAGVLKEIGLGDTGASFLVSLFSFNLGVEIGQIAFAVVVLPLPWYLRRSSRFVRLGVPVLSVLVAAMGIYWFVECVFLS